MSAACCLKRWALSASALGACAVASAQGGGAPAAAGAQVAAGGKAAPGATPMADATPMQAAVESILTPETLVEKAGTIVLILGLCYFTYRAVVGALRRAMQASEARMGTQPGAARQRHQRAVTIMALLSNIVRWAVSILALIWVMAALGVNLVPVLTGVGFLGAAFAFGAQTLVRDIVSGFFLLLEGQYAVGDYVELAGKFGRVEVVGLRTTVLRTLDNQLHHVPNGAITTCTVYDRPAVAYTLRVPVQDPAQVERAAELLAGMIASAREQFPLVLLEVGECQAHRSEEGVSAVTVAVSVPPTQDWMAKEELPNRARVVLVASEIALPEGLAPGAALDLSRMPAPLVAPAGSPPTA
jgi:moderate conductance mechanosensitive channel